MTVAPRAPSERRIFRPAQLAPLRRRLRADAGATFATVALVALTCGIFAALPRLFDRVSDHGLRYAVAHAAPLDRNVQANETARIPAGAAGEPLARVARRAALIEDTLTGPLRRVVGQPRFVVRSQEYAAAGPPGIVRLLTLVEQSGVHAHIRLVAGRMPGPTHATVRAAGPVPQGLRLPQVVRRVPLVEIALSVPAARQLRLHVGDRTVLAPDQTAGTEYTPIADERPLAVRVVGLFAVPHADDPFWFGDTRLDEPEVTKSLDLTTTDVYAEALLSPHQYPTMLAATRPLGLSYEYRYFTDGRRIDASQVAELQAAAAGLNARYVGAGPLDRSASTGLDSVLAGYLAERSQAETLLAVAIFGLLACALANVALLAALSRDRRRSETGLVRTRGALPRQVLCAEALEGLLLAAPAGLAGWGVALLAVHSRSSSLSGWLVLAVVIASVLVLTAGIVRYARGRLRPPERDEPAAGRTSPRRLVLEAVIVVLAGLGVYLLQRRGLASASGGIDPYLAAVPVLLALGSGILVLRLYPLPVAAAARGARRARGLALHLALSRAARQSELALAPLLVLVLTLAIALFSVAMLRTLEAGQVRTAWNELGADIRVDAPPGGTLPSSLVARLGREGLAAAALVSPADTPTGGSIFVALDAAAYERVTSGTPSAAPPLDALSKPSPLGNFVPALVSRNWTGGSTFDVGPQKQELSLVATGQVRAFAGIPAGTPFAVASLQAIDRQAHVAFRPNRLYVRGVSVSAARRAAAATAPGASVTSRADVVAGLRASPFVGSVLDGFRFAIALAAAYAAVAIVLLALIASRSQARDLALVRTMGGSPRQVLLLAAAELVPPLAVAVVLGLGLGAALLYLVAPAIDISFFTGNGSRLLSVPWIPAFAVGGAAAAVAASAVVLAAIRARRAELNRVLRIGER